MTQHYRRVVIAPYFEGRKFRDIANELQIPLGTVGTLLYRSWKKMRKVLRQANFEA